MNPSRHRSRAWRLRPRRQRASPWREGEAAIVRIVIGIELALLVQFDWIDDNAAA
jgi:hypothetical protein